MTDDDSIPIEFINYFEKNYIGLVRGRGPNKRQADPIFPINIWNQYDRVCNHLPRTNNNCEALNSALRNSVTSIHPNIWSLLTTLKDEEALSAMKLLHYHRGDPISKKRKYQNITERITNLVTEYCDESSKLDYFKSVATTIQYI